MKSIKYFFMSILILMLAACGSDSSSETPEKTTKDDVVENSTTEQPEENVEKEETPESKEEATKEEPVVANVPSYADALKEEMLYLTEEQAELSQESYDYIVNNGNILPAKSNEDIALAKEKSEVIDIKLLNKNLRPFYSTITSFEGYVVQIEEENYDNGETASWVNVYDDNGNNHILYIYKSTGDILEEDRVQFWGIPVASYSYETLDGGYQNALMFFGSHIEKK